MNLITPGFAVAGLLLAGIPVLIHILNRRRYREQQWAAMEFLLRAMKKNRKRLRFEQWILLAVRCLLLGLLGLALARPGGCEEGALSGLARQSGVHVLVLDDSYSMQYQADRPGAATHLEQMKIVAGKLIDRMTPGGDSVAIVTASKPARVIFPRGYDLEAARAAVARLEATALGTDLGGALRLATEVVREGPGETVRALHVMSDGTRSSLGLGDSAGGGVAGGGAGGAAGAGRAAVGTGGVGAVGAGGGSVVGAAAGGVGAAGGEAIRVAGREAREAFTHVMYHHLGMANQQHATLVEVGPVAAFVTARQTQELRAVARSFGGEQVRVVQWRLDDQILPGGQEVRLSETSDPVVLRQPIGRAGVRVLTATLVGQGGGAPTGERLPLDGERRRVMEVEDRVRVLLVEGERGGAGGGGGAGLTSSGAFLRLALAPPAAADAVGGSGSSGKDASVSPIEPDVISDLELPGRVLNDYRAVILTAVGQIADDTARQLRAYVDEGGVVVVFMGEGVSAESYNRTMLPRRMIPGALVKRVSAAEGAGFTFAFNPNGNLHPMLAQFRNQTQTGLDTAQTFTYWQVDLGAGGAGATTAPAGRLEGAAVAGGASGVGASNGGAGRVERVLDFVGGARDAAITQESVGKGRVVFVATSAGADSWTTLPARPVFVTLMQEMVQSSLTARDGWLNLLAGERLEVPSRVRLAGTPELLDPSGRAVAVGSEAEAGVQGAGAGGGRAVWRSEALRRPGVYKLKGVVKAGAAGGTEAAELPVAVNVDAAAEGDVRTVDEAGVIRALGDIEMEVVRDQLPPERVAEAGRGSDFGWIVMLCVLGFVGVESFLAMRFGHHPR